MLIRERGAPHFGGVVLQNARNNVRGEAGVSGDSGYGAEGPLGISEAFGYGVPRVLFEHWRRVTGVLYVESSVPKKSETSRAEFDCIAGAA